jgi:putative membrane protein
MMDNSRIALRTLVAGVMVLTACASGGNVQAVSAPGAMADADVAAVAHAANLDEIQTSQVALQRSQNAQVRQFAEQMIAEHTAADREMRQMLQAKGMAVQPNPAAVQATATTVANLGRRTGLDFDRAYMAHQVRAHRWTLASLDRTLIPSTRDPELKAFLTTRVRPAVAMHLEMAERHGGTEMK